MNNYLQDTNVNEENAVESESGASDNENTQSSTSTNTGTSDNNTDSNSDNSDNSDSNSDGNVSENTPFLVARYNKTDVPLTQEQAIEFAQKGMHYEDKLDYLATIKGNTINEFLKKAIDDIDNAERSRLEEQFGDDTEMIDKCMKIFHDEQKAKYEKAIADRKLADEEKEKNRVAQIGEEFISLQKDFPELKTIEDIPKEVLSNAGSMKLEHAYLRYLHKENQNKQEAIAKQQEAESKSTGSMSSDNNSSDSVRDDFINGIWDR